MALGIKVLCLEWIAAKTHPHTAHVRIEGKASVVFIFKFHLCSILPLMICNCCLVAKSCPAFCDPMDCSTPGSPVLHYHLLEFAQIYVHWVGGAIQSSHPPSPPSPPALSLSQHQGLFHWVSSSYQVVKIVKLKLQHQSFQWIFRVDFL